MVTIDTDFGKLVYSDQAPHRGIIRLPDVPPQRRIELMADVIERHGDDIVAGAVITIRGGRIRVSRKSPPSHEVSADGTPTE